MATYESRLPLTELDETHMDPVIVARTLINLANAGVIVVHPENLTSTAATYRASADSERARGNDARADRDLLTALVLEAKPA